MSPLIVHTVSFPLPLRLTLKLHHTKYHIWSTLFVQEMGCRSIRKCSKVLQEWSMTFTFDIMKVEGTSDSIFKSLVVQIILFLSNLTLKLHIKYQIRVHSQNGKWDAMLQGEISIAYEVVHNLPLVYKEGDRIF